MVSLQSSTMARAGSLSSKERYEKKRPAVAVRLAAEERNELRRIATLHGKGMGDVVREALFAYLGTDVPSWEVAYGRAQGRSKQGKRRSKTKIH